MTKLKTHIWNGANPLFHIKLIKIKKLKIKLKFNINTIKILKSKIIEPND